MFVSQNMQRVVWQLNNESFSRRERFKYVCNRTINIAVVGIGQIKWRSSLSLKRKKDGKTT